MTTTRPEDESPHDDTDEQYYDTDAAVAIATDRIAEDLDPGAFGAHHRLDELLAEFAEDVRDGGVSDMRIADVRTHMRNLDDALDELRRLYGLAEERPVGETEDRTAGLLDAYDVSRDDLGSTRIDVSEIATAYVYDRGDPDEVELDLRALDADAARDGVASLSPGDAYRLRQVLDETLTAREAERRRYDRAAEPGE